MNWKWFRRIYTRRAIAIWVALGAFISLLSVWASGTELTWLNLIFILLMIIIGPPASAIDDW